MPLPILIVVCTSVLLFGGGIAGIIIGSRRAPMGLKRLEMFDPVAEPSRHSLENRAMPTWFERYGYTPVAYHQGSSKTSRWSEGA